MLLVAFAAGAIPFSYFLARALAGTDLRDVGTGTVSGTGLYRVSGFIPLAVGGLCDVGKGSVGPLLAGDRWLLVALAGAAAVIGHNWSPLIGGAGGRGLSPALGALAVVAWLSSLFLLAGLAVGRLLHHTGLAVFITLLALPGFLLIVGDGGDALAGGLMVVVVLLKRVTGNEPLAKPGRWKNAGRRLVFDNDG